MSRYVRRVELDPPRSAVTIDPEHRQLAGARLPDLAHLPRRAGQPLLRGAVRIAAGRPPHDGQPGGYLT
ncbi:MAG TPA: hypothetical protein VHG52_14140 [Thermomicrobiales bacterium]|nr:hypothetical protein [Thermomicrobiales bacterium]